MTIKFEPRDLWIGIFWDRAGRITSLDSDRQQYHVYICIVPCFPIIFTISKKIPHHRRSQNW